MDHHVAAGGGKLHELGARILCLEPGDVQGDVVHLLVRFRVMDIGKALLSTQDLCRCDWEMVFLADSGDAYLVRKALGTRITLVKKRRAWYLRVKLKPHIELPYAEGEKFLQVMSLDRGAGVRLVEGGGSSSRSGSSSFLITSRRVAPVKKLVAPSAPTAAATEHTASGHAVFRI